MISEINAYSLYFRYFYKPVIGIKQVQNIDNDGELFDLN